MSLLFILGRFSKLTNEFNSSSEHMIIQKMLDGINVYGYIINDDYRLLHCNNQLRELVPDIEEGSLCYEKIWGRSSPCELCPMKYDKKHINKYHSKSGKHLSIDMIRVNQENNNFCIFTAIDTTQQHIIEKNANETSGIDPEFNIKNKKAFCKTVESNRASNNEFYAMFLRMKKSDIFIKQLGRDKIYTHMKLFVDEYVSEFSDKNIYSLGHDQMLSIIVNSDDELNRVIDWVSSINFNEAKLENGMQFIWDIVILPDTLMEKNCNLRMESAELSFHKLDKYKDARVMWIDESIYDGIVREKSIKEFVLDALKEDKFELSVQSISNPLDKKVHSYEVLSRLRSPFYGWISPEEFINILEQIDAIEEFTVKTIEKLFGYIKDKGLYDISFHMNVPPAVLITNTFYEKCTEWKREYPSIIKNIAFEITENQSISLNRMRQAINLIQRLGFSTSVDDFGSGYSNLNYLVELPVSSVKLDKKLIQQIDEHVSSQILLSSIIDLAHKLGINVIAEGVENQEQLEILIKFNCDYVQGYLFSRPILIEEFDF